MTHTFRNISLGKPLGMASLAFALLALAACRQDMHNQPKFKPLRENTFYRDLRSERPIIEGTVARGDLEQDTYYYTGKVNGQPGTELPVPVTAELLRRGQERFNIYCSPCHSRVGDGNGMIVQRGFKRPPSYHIDRLRNAPIGHFFDVMTNGFGAMSEYKSQVSVADRWAIAAYIRALQLSQNAQQSDLPAGAQVVSESQLTSTVPATNTPGSGATEPPKQMTGGETK